MKLVADECIDRPIVEELRTYGHDVTYVPERNPGITDDEVLALANDSGAILLTGDRDFGELVCRQGRVSCGIVLIRLHGLTNNRKALLVRDAFEQHSGEFPDAFTVISPTSIRIRRSGDWAD